MTGDTVAAEAHRAGRRSSGAPPAVILGFEANGLGVARALASRGVVSVGLALPGPNPCRHTRACRVDALVEWSEPACVEALLALGRTFADRAPLLITKDEAVLWVSRHRSELRKYYELNLPRQEVIDTLMNKRAFTDLATREGWPVPRTWFIDDRAEFRERLHEVVFPCILKPQVKNSAFRANAPAKAFRASNRDELIAAFELVSRWEPEVVVQEWIPGDDDRVAFCLGYCDREGTPLALFAGRKLRQWPIDCGNTALSEPAPDAWADSLTGITARIWRAVGFRGLGSIEFKMRPGTDEPVITEPTVGRTNYQNELAVVNGVNIPLIAWQDLSGRRSPDAIATRPAVKLIDGGNEIRAAMAYRRAGRLRLSTWFNQRRGRSRYMLLRANDPLPFLVASAARLRILLGRMVEGVLGTHARRLLGRLLRRH